MVLLFFTVAVLAGTTAMIVWVALIGALLPQRRGAVAALAWAATACSSIAVFEVVLSRYRTFAAGGTLVQVAFVVSACSFGGPIGWTAARPGRCGDESTPVLNGLMVLSGLATATWVLPGSCVALLSGSEGLTQWFRIFVILASAFAATSLSRKRSGL